MARVTIAEVARRAGVSPTAVSFTFHRPEELSAETVERVLEVARELGYAPNPHARALLSRRSGVMGLLVPERISDAFANPFHAAFVQGVGGVCDQKGLSLMIVSPHDGSLGEAITRAPADGFIVLGLDERHPDVSPLYRRGVPLVIVDGESRSAPSVNSDDECGAYEAAACTLSQGSGGDPDVLVMTFVNPRSYLEDPYRGIGERRKSGYRRAFEEYGARWSEPTAIPRCSVEDGARRFGEILDSGRRPDAVVCAGDGLALGVLAEAEERGLAVPEDLEVVGFDDVPQAALSRPALSTVRQQITGKGERAARLLSASLESGRSENEDVVLPTQLVLRRTTRIRSEG